MKARIALYLILMWLGTSVSAKAMTQPNFVTAIRHWLLLKDGYGPHTVCYAVAYPIWGPVVGSHGGRLVLIVAMYHGHEPDVVIDSVGGRSSGLSVRIGPKRISFHTQDNMAFAPPNPTVIQDFKKFERVYVPVETQDHAISVAAFSLMGFTKAYALTKDMCSIDWTGHPMPEKEYMPDVGQPNA